MAGSHLIMLEKVEDGFFHVILQNYYCPQKLTYFALQNFPFDIL